MDINISFDSSIFYLPTHKRDEVDFRASPHVFLVVGKNSSPNITGWHYLETVANMFLYLSNVGIDSRYSQEHFIHDISFTISCKIVFQSEMVPEKLRDILNFWNSNFHENDRFTITRYGESYHIDMYFDNPIHNGVLTDTDFRGITEDEAYLICFLIAKHEPYNSNGYTISGIDIYGEKENGSETQEVNVRKRKLE